MTLVYSTNIDKGGVGKTTITFNGAFYLAVKKGQRVLLIDEDKSCNLTKRYKRFIDLPVPEESTVKEFFTESGDPQPIKITENIDLIAGYSELNDLTNEVTAGKGRGYLMTWYYSHLDELEGKYDYILIDTHNDLGIFTDNAIAVSDYVLSIADIDEDAIEKLQTEETHIEKLKKAFVNPMTNKSFVTAQLLKVGNKVQSNTRDSHMFKKAFEVMQENDPTFLGYFEFRTLFAQAKTTGYSLVELEPDYTSASYREFFERTWSLYDKIYFREAA